MNTKLLRQFLVDANYAGYASGKIKKWVKAADGSTSILFEKGSWKSHDNFFGGEPYGGRTIVIYKNQPYWMMVYYGWVEPGVEADPVYRVLRGALKQMPAAHPFRGPQKFKSGDYTYINSWLGEIDRFSGEEQIKQGRKLIYQANYIGGLVDQRQGI